MNKPLVSVVMPAYNCERFIARAIESIIAQTYENWELIITEDGSTDNTYRIANKYRNERIHIYQTPSNSGTAFIPRRTSFINSKGEYVISVDSDDYLEGNYISDCIEKIQRSNADSCCGKMVMIDDSGSLLDIPTIPDSSFDFNQIMSGREAFLLTVPRYRIAMNGFISKREIWQKAWDDYDKTGRHGVHDDENLGKLMLMYSEKVAFCDVIHYYTINTNSITHVFNDKAFDWMLSNEVILKIVKEYYGDGHEFHQTELSDYYSYVHVTEFLAQSLGSLDSSDLPRFFMRMKEWHNRINWKNVRGYDGTVKWLIGKNFNLRWFCKLAQHRAIKYLKYIIIT